MKDNYFVHVLNNIYTQICHEINKKGNNEVLECNANLTELTALSKN